MLSVTAIDVVILCGGLGTRLRSVVSDRPKPMAEVEGIPFVEHLMGYAAAQGARRFLLCAGHLGSVVETRYPPGSLPWEVEVVVESSPLGTGGAVRNVLDRIRSNPVLVLNGDSFCETDLSAFLRGFIGSVSRAGMVLARAAGDRFGRVDCDPPGPVRAFREKGASAGEGWINAGVYLLSRAAIESIPVGRPVSLEREMFPAWIGPGLYGFPASGAFIDIGLPEEYRRAAEILRSMRRA